MKTIITLSLLFAATNAFAAKSSPATYFVNGKTVSAQDAILAAIRGSEVSQCKPVEMKISKSGSSVGLHVKKLSAN